jgi:hypothetical protein
MRLLAYRIGCMQNQARHIGSPEKRMHLLAALLFVVLILLSSNAHAIPGSRCVSDDFLLRADTLRTAKVTLPVFAHFCYRDKSGDYVVYLTESGDRRYGGETLSSKIGAYLFKITAGPTLTAKGTVSDSAPERMAGVQWWTRLTELNDIDGDGLIDPILVYRFYASDDGKMLNDAYEGRLKIIAFHRDDKAAIRTITGRPRPATLDHRQRALLRAAAGPANTSGAQDETDV